MRDDVEFVLVRPSHPGNIGAAARAIATMGFRRLCVVAPRFDDALEHPQARAFASGATDLLAQTRIVDDLSRAIADAHWVVGFSAETREFAAAVRPPRAMAAEVVARLAAAPPVDAVSAASVAVVFGTERTGLSIAEAQLCQRICSIETDPGHTSLNLAQAVQLAAYVLREAFVCAFDPGAAFGPAAPTPVGDGVGAARWSADPAPTDGGVDGSPASREPGDRPATSAQLEGLYGHLESMLVEIGFLDLARPKRLMPRLRNLFGRSRPSVTEVDILRGICTRILEDRDRAR
ncbi:MAG: RNA methyltransferase [Burkholderiaceae bacterium]